MRERGMYWDDLRSLIRRNQAPNAYVTFYRDERVDPTSISIFDRNLLHRKPSYSTETGAEAFDHWRDSLVCSAAFFGGEIPMENNKGRFGSNNPTGSEFNKELYRGVLGVLERLLVEGCIERSDELRELFTRHGRRIPSPSV